MKKLLIKKGWFKPNTYGIKNMWIIHARNGTNRQLRFYYEMGGKAAWFFPCDLAWVDRNKISLGDHFLDWQRPTLTEDTLFELETGYSLQKIFRITIPEDY